ncbi:MAG TPA: hypothetical protein VGH99_17585 [Pseudonocardia sp.]
MPDQVVVVDSLPMTPAGKIRKAALRDAVAEEGGPDNPAARTDPD